jgi:hypothetical protein
VRVLGHPIRHQCALRGMLGANPGENRAICFRDWIEDRDDSHVGLLSALERVADYGGALVGPRQIFMVLRA